MLHWQNKKHPEDTKGGKLEIIDLIIKGLISTYVEIHEPHKPSQTSDFTEELRDLIFKHVLAEKKTGVNF